jgi:hypothetical protein
MSSNAAREARRQQTLARLQTDVSAQAGKEKKQKKMEEKAYEAKLEAEKKNPRCEEWQDIPKIRVDGRINVNIQIAKSAASLAFPLVSSPATTAVTHTSTAKCAFASTCARPFSRRTHLGCGV